MFYIDPIYVLMGLVAIMIVFIALMGGVMLKMVNLLGGIINEIHRTSRKALRRASKAARVAKEAHVIASTGVLSGNGVNAEHNDSNNAAGPAILLGGIEDPGSRALGKEAGSGPGHSKGAV
jgi:hypothetical protein